MRKHDEYYSKYDFKTSLEYGRKANQLALKLKDSELIAQSYQKLAATSISAGLYNESLEYANQGLKQDYTKSDLWLQSNLHEILGIVYGHLGFKDQSNKNFREIINTIPQTTKNTDLKRQLASAYFHIGNSFDYEPENADSIEKYMGISNSIYEKCPENEVYDDLYFSYLSIGGNYLELRNEPDSAKLYFQKALSVIKKHDPDFFLIDYDILMGRYYFLIKDYKNALEFYLKSAAELENAPHDKGNIRQVYKDLSDIYDSMGDYSRSKLYLEKYTEVNLDMLEKNKNTSENALQQILNKENQKKNANIRKYAVITAFIALVIIMLSAIYYVREKKKNKKIYKESLDVLQEKDSIILQKEREEVELKQKANESFNEVLLLAKENNPHFLKRFREVYPEFYYNILKVNANLKPSEITLAAYIFLGFTNKEIADYTFKSVRTIESNRYNLRKKLNLPTDIDFHVWLNTLN